MAPGTIYSNFGLVGYIIGDIQLLEPKVVRLERVSASVVVRGFVSHVTVKLVYKNLNNDPLEVCYRCPVDSKSAIYHFEAKLDGRTIKAKCMEKKKAKEVYDEAVQMGHTAIYAAEDKNAGDLFYMRLGNLPPGEEAELSLSMVSELPVESDGAVYFVLPTVFTPRYSPVGHIPGPEPPTPATNDAAIVTENSYTMDIKAKVVGGQKIERIVSNTDNIHVEIGEEDNEAVITQNDAFTRDHDWSMRCYYQSPHKPHVLQESGDRSGIGIMKDEVIMASFFPELPSEAYSPHNELIFLVDRSGSMRGERISFAKSSLLMFLKSLPLGCRFNIVSFGNSHSKLFSGSSERYTEATLAAALKLQQSMDADMGGTEIFTAIKSIYDTEPVPGYARQVLVLTDGDVWNVGQIVELISRHRDESRVFSIGVGSGASTALLRSMADAGGGRCEMVLHATDMQTKVMGLLSSMLQESVTNIVIRCQTRTLTGSAESSSEPIRFVPKIPRVIFGGQHLICYARLAPNVEISSIEINGSVRGSSFSLRVLTDQVKRIHDTNLTLHRLAAKAQIKKWEVDEIDPMENVREKIISLSESTGVVSQFTGLVGADHDNVFDWSRQQRHSQVDEVTLHCGRPGFSFAETKRRRGRGAPTFGSSTQSQPPTFTFGSSTQNQSPAFLCGSSTHNQPKTFGSSNQNQSAAFGGFGSSAQNQYLASEAFVSSTQNQPTTFGGFGSSNQNQPPTFGAKFVGSTENQPLNSRWDQKLGACATSSLFGGNEQLRCAPLSQQSAHIGPQCLVDSVSSEAETLNQDDVLAVISSQEFDGSWKIEPIKAALTLTDDVWTKLEELQKKETTADEMIITTILVLLLLKLEYQQREQEWKFVAIKARQYLSAKDIDETKDIWLKVEEIVESEITL